MGIKNKFQFSPSEIPFILYAILLSLIYTGCNLNVFFSPLTQPVGTFSVTPLFPTPVFTPEITPGPLPTNNVSIRTIQPALAVRGLECLMCHANVRSNIITDFGYGDPWYLGSPDPNIEDSSWYANHANTWQSAEKITGQVFIPSATTPASLMKLGNTPVSNPMSLLELFSTSYDMNNDFYAYPIRSRTTSNVNKPMSASIEAPEGLLPVVVKQQIIIRAPTSFEILNLVPEFALNPTTVAFQEIRSLESSAPSTNFELAGSVPNQYVTNPSTNVLQCYGDVVINGPLFLKQPVIATDHGGCRLYVNGTVFIEGGITYALDSPSPNLQISSTKAILMGLGTRVLGNTVYKKCGGTKSPLQCRMQEESRNAMVRGYNSYSGPQWSVLANEILADAAKVVANNGPLIDAEEATSPGFDSGLKQASIDFKGLLLNAPVIQSRYLGLFRGTLISEIALFSLGDFYFEFDPVFMTVPAFPLLKSDLLFVH